MKRLGLRAKFIVLILGLQIIIFSLITVVLVRQNTNTLRANLERDSKTFATLSSQPIGASFVKYKDAGRLRIRDEVNRFTDLDNNISNVVIVDTVGRQQFSLVKGETVSVTPGQAASFQTTYFTNDKGVISKIIVPYFEELGAHRYSIVYGISSQAVEAAAAKVIASILFFVLLGLISSVALSYWLINWLFINPLRQLSQQAVAISAGRLDVEIQLDRQDEIADLAQSVNKMSQSLKDDIAKLKETDRLKTEFMIIASHNLRTPLTVINGYLDMKDELQTIEQMREALNAIASRSKQLGVFAEDVLTISSIEAGKHILTFEEMDICKFVASVADEFRDLAIQKQIDFKTQFKIDSARAKISQPHLRSAIWNLLDNSLKFTEAGGAIDLSVDVKDRQILIAVKDTGIGIETSEIPKLFTKFHRGTDILKYNYAGTGIGLYVTKLVIDEHSGTISVESNAGQGSTFTIALPLIG